MNKSTTAIFCGHLAIAACLLAAATGRGAQVEVHLRAGATTLTMADGRSVAMWGFARDSAADVEDGAISVPGPAIALGPDAQSLVIHLKNTLPAPVSVVIPGQFAVQGNPARNDDGRVRSLTHEAPPGGSATYTWPSLAPGTYMYHSGSHPALQVQMGLYGAVTRLHGFGEAYPGVRFEREIILLFSEIDPDLHDAVAADAYGPDKSVTSTLEYVPQYFMINSVSYTNGLMPVFAGRPGDRILLRLINAGLDYHVPSLDNGYFTLLAEDGYPQAFPRETYAVMLPPLKAMDALFSIAPSAPPRVFAMYDRRLGVVNAASLDTGGMLTHLSVDTPPFPSSLTPEWIIANFGPGPVYPPGTTGPQDDPDGDGVSNLNEFISGTDPNDPLSNLRIVALAPPRGGDNAVVTFGETAAGRLYNVESTTNLAGGVWTTIHTNVAGFPGVMWLTDTQVPAPARYYRIKLAGP